MRRIIKLLVQTITSIKSALLLAAFFSIYPGHAQEKQAITGKIFDQKSNQPVPFANIALLKQSDSAIINGTVSDFDGFFRINQVLQGNYSLKVSVIGYRPFSMNIDIVNNQDKDAGIIYISDSSIILKETVIVAEKVKAKSESGRTSFYMTKKLLDATNTGVDVLKMIPGVQVDLMHNISLEGSPNVLIFVDGKEREKDYVNQINPGQIEKVEIISMPPSNYDGNVTGVINIVLKKDRDKGINGHIYAEIPTSSSEVYIFPTYSLNYGFKKLNIFTSYNGDISRFHNNDRTEREIRNGQDTSLINSNQHVMQVNWSHKFNYGFDYFLSPRDQFNFYAFYNISSYEYDGNADAEISGNINSKWQAKKDDANLNTGTFYSLYYKHIFANETSEITLDISNYHLKSETSVKYTTNDSEITSGWTNSIKPRQNAMSIKLDYKMALGNKLNFNSGIKTKFQSMRDKNSNSLNNEEKILAAYGTIDYKNEKTEMSLGLRAEQSVSVSKEDFNNQVLSFLPYFNFNFKPSQGKNIRFSLNRSVYRPNIYQLNPYVAVIDPYSISKGNPFLKSQLQTSMYLEYSNQFKSNYVSYRLFYNNMADVIDRLSFINDSNVFETRFENLGTIHELGTQFTGSLKLGALSFNSYLRLFGQYSDLNLLAKEFRVKNRYKLVLESGLSAILSFKHDFAFSVSFQYATPKNNIQDNLFCDALYYISIDKTFRKKLKTGISIIPISKPFIYRAHNIEGADFYNHNKGIIDLTFPLFIKLSYQFNSGKKRDKINRTKEEIDVLPDKGF